MRISITSEPRLLHVLRGVVRCRALEAGFQPSDADCLAMAIDEAAANVIRHAYRNRSDGKLALAIESFPDRLEFALEDQGSKVEAQEIKPRSLEDLRPGGLGTYFIRCFMDAAAYDQDFPGGNRLRMVKYLPRKASGTHEGSNQKCE